MSGRLVFISDLEGCAIKDNPGKENQSSVMCDEKMFTAIKKFLDENEKNKVAFLGDYFDKGPHIVDSINSIANLIESHHSNVIIILGNRDINKFRLIYEMREEHQTIGEKKWVMWNNFYKNLPDSKTLEDRLKCILKDSMGALQPGEKELPKIDPHLNEIQSAYLLLKAFSTQNAELYEKEVGEKLNMEKLNEAKYEKFITSVRSLFKHGKIVHYDSTYKTLMSHAGGMDPFFFHTSQYYDDILQDHMKSNEYYEKIEEIRRALQKGSNHDSEFHETTYNEPLNKCKDLFDSNEDPPKEYFLLQALGLKPDNDKHFVSFVESCDIQGCRGPNGHDIKLRGYDMYEYRKYIERLLSNKIHIVASGHVPHCAPVPLIYTRPENRGVIFIANDVSNGYRPSAIKGVNQVPLSFVEEGGKVGIMSLDGSPNFTHFGDFEDMIGEWEKSDVPKFKDDHIQYAEKKLIFTSREKGGFSPAVMKGGYKKYRKTTRRNRKSKHRRTVKY